MNDPSRAPGPCNFAAELVSWGIPAEIAGEMAKHHTLLNYRPGTLVFSQGSPADVLLWVVKGVVRELSVEPNGSQTLVRLASTGDVIGFADQVNDAGLRVRRFEAWTATPCVLALVTRQHVRKLLASLNPERLVEVIERLNSAWSGCVHYLARMVGLASRDRLTLAFTEMARRFGVADRDGILLTYEPTHSDLAEMIGCSRPAVSRLIADMMTDGDLGRRDRKYVLLVGGAIAANLSVRSRDAKLATSHPQISGRGLHARSN